MAVRKTIPDAPIQVRAIQTRKDLMAAARRIFARDGFEAARLQDIAEDAGKTRGALYSHFSNKEDLFFALIEEDIENDAEFYEQRITPGASTEERIKVLVDHMESVLCDRKRILLYLEFKMYAIQHPHEQKRLADLHMALCAKGMENKMRLIPELREKSAKKRRYIFATFGVVLDGLALNMYFDPGALSRDDVRSRIEQVVRQRFQDAMPANVKRLIASI